MREIIERAANIFGYTSLGASGGSGLVVLIADNATVITVCVTVATFLLGAAGLIFDKILKWREHQATMRGQKKPPEA